MEDAKVETEYLSIGANRQTAVADWSTDGVVAFGADTNIALWRPDNSTPKGIIGLLSGHQNVVKAVKFIPRQQDDESSFLVTGGDDQCLKLWMLSPQAETANCVQTVQEHAAPINCIAVLGLENGRCLVASGAADASIKVWSFDGEAMRLLQSIKTTPKYFPLTLALCLLGEGEGYMLASGGTKDIVQIFTAPARDEKIEFKLQATLSGHEAWIRSLDFTREKHSPDSDLLLASASQDKYVRLWRIHRGTELPAQAATASDPSLGAYLPGKSPSNKAYRMKVGEVHYSITFEALLFGHEDWIYSAKWHFGAEGKLQLMSTSADNSLAIWEAEPTSGIWITSARLGEISREKGATTATGSIGGFWTGLWSPNGTSLVTLGRTGSWRRWDYDTAEGRWVQGLGVTGHVRAVTGVSWSRNGDYLLSTSSDQTTRLHAQWKATSTWHEMSRPQIHGYDLNCIDSLGASQFVSGADEKLMRVFGEPKTVANLLNRLGGIGSDAQTQIEAMPDAANMPVLGLSNKAVDAVDDDQDMAPVNPEKDHNAVDPATVVRKSALDMDHPPFEDSLSRDTLWPEIEKLYGHGYEISCLAVSHDGKLIASACKASSINHAVIRLFETERWTEIRPPLTAHSLTTTRLRFSSDDQYLLSVGRDRQWAVFERDAGDAKKYDLAQADPKGHSRMILDAAWAPGEEQRAFATAGRDKQVKIWARKDGQEGSKFSLATTIKEQHPVTAVDFLQQRTKTDKLVLALGTEAGKISICILKQTDLSLEATVSIKTELALPKAVLQLAWRPVTIDGDYGESALAIAGEDGSLRIYQIKGL